LGFILFFFILWWNNNELEKYTKPSIRGYCTYNRSILENNPFFPFRPKAEFYLSYAQYISQNKSFLLDIFSDYYMKPNHSYLLLIYVNNVFITTDRLIKMEITSKNIINNLPSYCSESSIIQLKLMHCLTWEEKCPINIMNFLNSTTAKNYLLRSKLRKFFNKYKQVPTGYGVYTKFSNYDESKYISPFDYQDLVWLKYSRKKQNKKKL
jgi:hypothetical protein